jgi:hypothetical protein
MNESSNTTLMKLYDIDLPTRSYQMFFEQAILSAERQDIQDERPSFEILPSLRALGSNVLDKDRL